MTDDETTIITGALDMTEKTAKDAMTPISKIFSLDINSVLDMYVLLVCYVCVFSCISSVTVTWY